MIHGERLLEVRQVAARRDHQAVDVEQRVAARAPHSMSCPRSAMAWLISSAMPVAAEPRAEEQEALVVRASARRCAAPRKCRRARLPRCPGCRRYRCRFCRDSVRRMGTALMLAKSSHWMQHSDRPPAPRHEFLDEGVVFRRRARGSGAGRDRADPRASV